jgi:hypothetical protein
MFQRLLLAFSVIVSFGFAQIGAVTHEISHYGDTKSQNQPQNLHNSVSQNSSGDITPDNQAPHNQVCEKCFSYAELGHAVHNAAITLAIAVTSQHYINSDSATSTYAKLRSYSARAPPFFA